jgi:hypothetical protein
MNELLRNHPRAAYDAIRDRVNFSTLKEMERSPAHYKWRLEHPKDPTDAMDLGNATHLAVLEPERFRAEVVEWTGKVRNGKKWDEFEAAHAGKLILPAADYDYAINMAEAVRDCDQARPFITRGHAEVTMLWEREIIPGFPIALKGRFDYLSPLGPVDLKTCADASREAFGRAVFNMGYLAQSALYLDGYKAITGTEDRFYIVAVEKEPPFIAQVYWLTDEQLAFGRELYTKWLAQVAFCRLEDLWPPYSTEPLPLTLPGWATKLAEQALSAEASWNSNQEQSNG